MFAALKRFVLRVLAVPPEPEDPFGGEGTLLVFRAAPNFYNYRLLTWAIAQFFALFGALSVIGGLHVALQAGKAPEWVGMGFTVLELVGLAGILFQVVFSWFALRLDYEMRWYKVTDRSLRIREGVFHVQELTMTFANVQNVSIDQGPLQRLLGIADVRVQSAGGGGNVNPKHGGQPGLDLHSALFRGVNNAEQIRDLIRERLRLLKGSGLGDHDDERAAAPHVALPGSDALAAVLSEARALRAAAESL